MSEEQCCILPPFSFPFPTVSLPLPAHVEAFLGSSRLLDRFLRAMPIVSGNTAQDLCVTLCASPIHSGKEQAVAVVCHVRPLLPAELADGCAELLSCDQDTAQVGGTTCRQWEKRSGQLGHLVSGDCQADAFCGQHMWACAQLRK